ncbi:MAG: putative endonuclease 4 [Candidatus Collierbacteria bacterium GW2011_GWB2_42_12]|nr:MAG: putative endonuclease 4 [Candidatus Collierbacteria bacterium GW2011_GWB2_42_12]
MRRIGGHVSMAGSLLNAVSKTRQIGGNCLQIFAGSPRLWFRKPFPDDQVEAFLKETQKLDISPTFIHALYLVNLASTNNDILEKSINSLVIDIQNGARIKSAGVIVHIGSHLGAGFDAVKDQLVAVIQRILASTENCNLILENDAGQNGKIGSPEEISSLSNIIDVAGGGFHVLALKDDGTVWAATSNGVLLSNGMFYSIAPNGLFGFLHI